MFFGATAFAEAPFSSEGIINQSVEVTGLQLQTNVSTVAISLGADVNVTTNLLQTEVTSVVITADANLNVTTNLINTALGNETITTDQNITVTSNILQLDVDSVSIEAGGNVSLAAGAEQELETTVNSVVVDIGTQVDLVGSSFKAGMVLMQDNNGQVKPADSQLLFNKNKMLTVRPIIVPINKSVKKIAITVAIKGIN